jgi:hypothetical protein
MFRTRADISNSRADLAHSRKLRNLIFVLLTCLAAWGGAAYAAWRIFA